MTEEDPRRQYSDVDFLDAVAKHTPASTSEVADEVGCTRRNADMRLKKLADEGKVKRKKIAASQVWALVES
ncbi:FaeA/PapI family transcriptional regulator [Haloplanus salilacus]|uniref:FaeA/PapI family transcriptional regulator n=1 Tax=Haloplanus salilacus TaxID=2949994 RepID=UPI0030CECEB3